MGLGDLNIKYNLTNCEKEIAKIKADIVILRGLIYDIEPGFCCVESVNGKTGVVVLNTGDVHEGSNLYYTNSRVQAFADTRYSLLGHKHPIADIIDFPLQAGHAGEFLTTNGTTLLWAAVPSSSSYTDEKAQDAIAAMLAAGTHVGITFVYHDSANSMDAIVSGGGGTPVSDEHIRDVIDATITDSISIDFTADDATDTITGTVKIPWIRGLFSGTPQINYNSSTGVIGLATSGVATGTYNNPTLTVDTFGRITTIVSGTILNNYTTHIGFNTANGNFTLDREGLSSLVVSLDGRYALISNAKKIRFTVGNAGAPVAGATTFTLVDCDGIPQTDKELDVVRERSELIPIRDYTYNLTTGLITLIQPLLTGETFIIRIYSRSNWTVCIIGTTPIHDYLKINSTDRLLINSTDKLII